MDPHTVDTLIMGALALIAAAIFLVPVGIFIHNIFQEASDESAEHSRTRREEYQSARLRIILMGFVTLLVFVGFTAILPMVL